MNEVPLQSAWVFNCNMIRLTSVEKINEESLHKIKHEESSHKLISMRSLHITLNVRSLCINALNKVHTKTVGNRTVYLLSLRGVIKK